MGDDKGCSWKHSLVDYPRIVPSFNDYVKMVIVLDDNSNNVAPDNIAVVMDGIVDIIPVEHFKRMVRDYCYANEWQWKETKCLH